VELNIDMSFSNQAAARLGPNSRYASRGHPTRLGANTKRPASTVSTNIGFFGEIARIVCPSVYGDLSGK
jgi:hypothetical protein